MDQGERKALAAELREDIAAATRTVESRLSGTFVRLDALERGQEAAVRERAQAVLAYDPENVDALAFLAAAERAQGSSPEPVSQATTSTATHLRPFGPLQVT